MRRFGFGFLENADGKFHILRNPWCFYCAYRVRSRYWRIFVGNPTRVITYRVNR